MLAHVKVCVLLALAAVTHLGATPLEPASAAVLTHGLALNEFIRHYEPARYEAGALAEQLRRSRRSTDAGLGADRPPELRLDVRGHGRVFRLRLRRDSKIFADDVEFEATGRNVNFDPSVVYSGTLEGDESAIVHGLVTSEGLFDGTVSTHLDHYYIEPVSRYLSSNQSGEPPPTFHSIIYKDSDVRKPQSVSSTLCASQRLHLSSLPSRQRRWLPEEMTNSKHPYDDLNFWHPNNSKHPLNPPFDLNTPYNQPGDDDSDLLIFANNRSVSDITNVLFRHVNKRATIDPKKTTCMLYLQADHQFFQKYGTEEACIEVMTRHVQRVNAIYRSTDFNQDGKPDNITFMIKRIKVHTMEALKDPLYRFPNNYGVEKFLELFSEEDYDAFCLAYMFTYRDFEMGTLGLAWTGDLKNAGGVCEKNGHYRGSMKSLNTGIVTLLNYGKHVPPAVSHVTLAHEIGHNFGSPHDPEMCTPGGEDGNFIMFARATSGDKKNNNHFSPCSLKSINPVLNFKARSPKGCFTEPQVALCGNGVVEDGEECDCGWEEDCRDECCFPQRRYPPTDEPPCRLTPRSVCSPSQGPCCTTECQLKFGDKCRDDNGCRDASYCNGRGPQCPPSVNKPNKTICNEEFVCFMGECTGSICLAYGLESCQCIPGPKDSKTKACELCCKLPGDNKPCISSFEWNEAPYDIPDMFSKPGTPCNDYNGYCDVFQKCREVDPSGPLATLRKLLLSEESIASFKKWVMDHWYAVALIVFGVFTLIVLSTKLLGKRPHLKLKSVTIMHSSTTETVRLPPDGAEGGGQVTVHPAVRSKLPLKRKVRENKMRKKRGKEYSVNNNDSPLKRKRLPKKKKRVSAPVGAEEVHTKPNETVIEVPPSKVKKSPKHATGNKKKKKKKEIIDYSKQQIERDGTTNELSGVLLTTSETDPVGKVQSWLLRSQQTSALPKSKSTPAGLTTRTNRSPHKIRPALRSRPDKSKALSVGHLPGEKDKLRLQVVYKPPFKFSLKLRKPEKTSAVVEKTEPKRPSGARTGVLISAPKRERTREPKRDREYKPREGVSKSHKRTKTDALPPLPTSAPVNNAAASSSTVPAPPPPVRPADDIDSNIHTVQSDLEVLLSESEFLFSDE